VLYCGFHDESTFGATSWLVLRPAGNVPVDVPRFSAPLGERIAALGGVKLLFLTHRDHVGDHEKFAARFGGERVLHRGDLTEKTRGVERLIDGVEPVTLAPDLLVIPTPGHPYAFRDACWHDWRELQESMRRLARFRFEWILPGHGAPGHASIGEMQAAMARCLDWLTRAG